MASAALVDVLQQLMRRNLLARFVVDEVTSPQMLTEASHKSVHVVLILISLNRRAADACTLHVCCFLPWNCLHRWKRRCHGPH